MNIADKIKQTGFLSAEEERRLYHEDPQALIWHHMGLAWKILSKYTDLTEDRDEIFSIAYIALSEALERYDPDRGRFSILVNYALKYDRMRSCTNYYNDGTRTKFFPRYVELKEEVMDEHDIEYEVDKQRIIEKCKKSLTNERYRTILYDRYLTNDPKSRRIIGKKFGVKQQAIAQNEETLLKQLRRIINGKT